MNRDEFLHDLNHTGFTVQRDAFDIDKINELNEFAETINPERGHTKDKKWIGWNQIKDIENPKTEIDWAYYWTEQVHHPIINEMKNTLAQYADAAFGEHNWVWHVQDFIVLHPGMNFYRPHIDTPYRFPEFRYNQELLGLQFMVMMCDFNEHNTFQELTNTCLIQKASKMIKVGIYSLQITISSTQQTLVVL
jgi:hypothetical protein